jgi:hypothetical protein
VNGRTLQECYCIQPRLTTYICIFHRFPSNPETRKHWIAAVRRENFTPSKSAVLCSKQCLYKLHDVGVIFASLTFDGAAQNLSMVTNLGCNLDIFSYAFQTSFKHRVTGEKVFVFFIRVTC